MNRTILLLFFTLSAFIFFPSSPCFNQNLISIDSFIEGKMTEKQIPGLTIAILQNDKIIHKNAYGLSVIEHKVPAKMETIYELASLSKQFIAMGILILVEKEILKLDEPIESYLDTLPDKWKQLTLNQLLSHTAGLAPIDEEWKSLKKGSWPKLVTKEMLWSSSLEDSIFASPGEQFKYHNLGYSLALFIIEKVTGMDHRDFFQQRIFDKLGMSKTFFEDQIKVTPNQTQGYTLKNDEIVKIWRVGQEEIGVGDGIYSCIEDMIRWNAALNNYELLSPDIQNLMFGKVQLNDRTYFRYGLGWWLPNRNDIPFYYHNGVTGTEYLKIPSHDLDIIILSNLGQGEYDEVYYWGLAEEIVCQFFTEKFCHQPIPQAINVADLSHFTGTFEYEEGGEVEIYVKDDNLYLKDSYGEALMIYQGNQAFILEEEPVIFKFLNENRIRIIEETWNDDFANRIVKK